MANAPSKISLYRNPLRGVKGLVTERVDQGVDYSGSGPIYAIGNGVVTGILGGWPGGPFIEYRLTEGPQAGHLIYVAENITSHVHVGQHVTSDTVIATMHGGIETGYASGRGSESLAMVHGQASSHGDPGSVSTAYGKAFSDFLHSLGAPAGKLTGKVSGTVAAGFPTGGGGGQPAGPASGGDIGGPSGFNWITGPLDSIPGFDWIGKVITGTSGTFSNIGDVAHSISGFVQEFGMIIKWIGWLFQPANWVRILAGLAGIQLVVLATILLVWAADPGLPGQVGSAAMLAIK